jgi:hypothetical protein
MLALLAAEREEVALFLKWLKPETSEGPPTSSQQYLMVRISTVSAVMQCMLQGRIDGLSFMGLCLLVGDGCCRPHFTIAPVQALINGWVALWPFLPLALVVDVPWEPKPSAAPAPSDLPPSDTSRQKVFESAQVAATLKAAQTALLPPTSPMHLAEWELGLLGLPEEQQGCFHAGCLNSIPPQAAVALTTPAADRSLHLCSSCRLVRYCGRGCQMAAWRAVHRHTCKLYAAALQRDAEMQRRQAAMGSAVTVPVSQVP